MVMKHKKSAFTLVELLAVLAIITILVALLIPALTMVRNMAREAQQKAQLTTIELALTAFKNDYGGYPPSNWHPKDSLDYAGTQKLTEALVGWDLLGFHPDSEFTADGRTKDDSKEIYDPDDEKNLKERRGPYLELATANVFKLGDLFGNTTPLEKETFVICDVFGVKRITLADGKNVKAGTPILYYRANTSSKSMDSTYFSERIYDARDNRFLVELVIKEKDLTPAQRERTLANDTNQFEFFYNYITDPKVTTTKIKWPYRPDSYILITAGVDGLYGTSDDIRNF